MPDLTPTLADWQAMTPADVESHIKRGVFPPIAGADDDPPKEDPPKEDPPKVDPPADPPAPTNADAPTAEDVANLNKALARERDARKAADKLVKDLKPKADAHDQLTEAQQSDLEKAQKEAEDARDALKATTSKVRAANLKVALGDAKYGLASAKAAATLLQAEGVEFDDNDEPIGLDEAVNSLVEANPFLTGEKPKPKAPGTNAGDGGGDGAKVHLTPEELAMAESFGMTAEEYAANKEVNPPETAAT